jgi:hypothetical protein
LGALGRNLHYQVENEDYVSEHFDEQKEALKALQILNIPITFKQ